MLLNSGSTSYPILEKIFYSNLSFTMIDGNSALRSFVKGQEIIISKTLVNDLLKLSNVANDTTPNILASQNSKDMFILDSYSAFSSTKQLTHNALNLCGKLLYHLLVRTVPSRNSIVIAIVYPCITSGKNLICCGFLAIICCGFGPKQ